MQAAAAQFPQYHFHSSTITAPSLASPAYITLIASMPIHTTAADALSTNTPFPNTIQTANASHQLLAAISSDHGIKLYDYTRASPSSSASIDYYAALRGHTKQVHDLKFHNVHSSYATEQVQTDGRCMLSSCSEDGTVRFWDVRQQQAAATFTHPKRKPFISCASAGNLLAAGSGPFFYLWDLRTSKLLAANEEFHMEDINQIAFHPGDASMIYTAGEDGLICILKPEDPDQDEWLQNVINIENPVSRFGFFGPDAAYVWALSTVETMSLWHVEECARISDFANVRHALSMAANMTIDYLIDAHYEQSSQRLFLASGCNSGELILSHVNKNEIQPFCLAHVDKRPTKPEANGSSSGSSAPIVSPVTGFALQPLANESPFALSSLMATAESTAAAASAAMMGGEDSRGTESSKSRTESEFLQHGEIIHNMDDGEGEDGMTDAGEEQAASKPIDSAAQGHTATIRDVAWFDGVLITGGEDSRLCIWSTQQNQSNGSAAAATSSSSSSSLKHTQRNGSASNDRQYRPY